MTANWVKASGDCGYDNVPGPIFAAYVNAVPLFCFQTSSDFWYCVVYGQMTCGGKTKEAAQASGEEQARKHGRDGADRVMSRAQFGATIRYEVPK